MAKKPEAPAKPNRIGNSGTEKMFWDEMDKMGVTMEALIWRSPREWLPDQYGYKMTKANGAVKTGLLPWDINTFPALLTMAKGE